MASLSRRAFLQQSVLGAAAWAAAPALRLSAAPSGIPSYLRGYESLYAQDPRIAAIRWLREARFGLFMHYGLYSLLGRGEWVQYWEKIPVADYAKLKDTFTAAQFDADRITDLALAAGMKYVNLTTRHHDSFCLFDSRYTDFKSTHCPAKRDLVAELSTQCQKKGLGLCLYYSHGRDWRHPHAPNNDEWGGNARPLYPKPDPAYATGPAHHLQIYVDFMKAQVTELLTNYGPIASIWLDGIAVPFSHPDRIGEFHAQELYDHIHSLQPQVLVAYKQALLGTEDYLGPERKWQGHSTKPVEICNTLQAKGWGYTAADNGKHKNANDVRAMLAHAASLPANLLLNTGLLPDGSVDADDERTLRAVGKSPS